MWGGTYKTRNGTETNGIFDSGGGADALRFLLDPNLQSGTNKTVQVCDMPNLYPVTNLSPWPSNHKLFFVTAIKIYH